MGKAYHHGTTSTVPQHHGTTSTVTQRSSTRDYVHTRQKNSELTIPYIAVGFNSETDIQGDQYLALQLRMTLLGTQNAQLK